MGPKKVALRRRKAEPTEDDDERRKKTKRVITDDESDEGVNERQQQNGHQTEMAPTTQREEEEDEVVSEVGIYLLPLASSDAGGISTMTHPASPSVCINRLQFPQQQLNMLRRRFNRSLSGRGNGQDGEEDEDDSEHQGNDRNGHKCFAQYKAQVKHLRLGFGSDGEEEAMASSVSNFAGGGGIAELLTRQNHTQSSSVLFSPPPLASSSTSSIKDGGDPSTSSDMFTGEGFSQHGLLNYAVGFFKEGRLFLLPVDKTYEMRKPLRGTIEREIATRSVALKASSSTSSASLRSLGGDSAAPSGTASASSSSAAVAAPLRIRFARAENDVQRRRREQSSFYKQKLVEQDQWIPLKVEHKNLMQMYEKDINRVLLSSECSSK